MFMLKYNIIRGFIVSQIATAIRGGARRTQENDEYKLLKDYSDLSFYMFHGYEVDGSTLKLLFGSLKVIASTQLYHFNGDFYCITAI